MFGDLDKQYVINGTIAALVVILLFWLLSQWRKQYVKKNEGFCPTCIPLM